MCSWLCSEKVGPLGDALIGSDDEGVLFAHGGEKAKEQIRLRGRERHEAHLVHHKGCVLWRRFKNPVLISVQRPLGGSFPA